MMRISYDRAGVKRRWWGLWKRARRKNKNRNAKKLENAKREPNNKKRKNANNAQEATERAIAKAANIKSWKKQRPKTC
jgi:hypothetical protein